MTQSGRSLASSFSDASIWLYDLGRVTGCHLSEPQLPYLHNRCFGLESHSEIPMVLFGEKKKKICGSTHLCRPAQVIHLSDSCPEGRVETLLAVITEGVFERRSLCRSNVVIVKGCKFHMGS